MANSTDAVIGLRTSGGCFPCPGFELSPTRLEAKQVSLEAYQHVYSTFGLDCDAQIPSRKPSPEGTTLQDTFEVEIAALPVALGGRIGNASRSLMHQSRYLPL